MWLTRPIPFHLLLCFECILYDALFVGAERYISQHPSDTKAIEGLSATFAFRITGVETEDNYEVDWWVKGEKWIRFPSDKADVNQKYSLISNTTGQYDLVIHDVTKDDESYYQCNVHNGRQTFWSTKASLSVLPIPIPRFADQSSDTTSYEGDSVVFKCHVVNFTPQYLKVIWVHNTVFISSNYEINDNITPNIQDYAQYSIAKEGPIGVFDLTIKNLSHTVTGQYYCFVTFIDSGDYQLFSNKAMLSVIYPSCNSEPSRDPYSEGDNITTHCTVEGGKLKSGNTFSCSKIGETRNSTGLEIDPSQVRNTWILSADDNGSFIQCSVQSSGKILGRPYTFGPLNVHFAPIVSIYPIRDVIEVRSNQSVTFNCTARGNPNGMDYTWLIDGVTVDGPDSRYKLEPANQTLTINQVQVKDDTKSITCMVTNSVGSSTTTTTLKVVSLPVKNEGEKSQTSDISIIILVSSVAAAVLVIVVIITILYVCLRRRKNMKAVKNPNMRLQNLQQDLTNRTNTGHQPNCNAEDPFEEFVQYEEICGKEETNRPTSKVNASSSDSATDMGEGTSEDLPDVTYAEVNKKLKNGRSTRDNSVKSAISSPVSPFLESQYTIVDDDGKRNNENENVEGLVYAELDHDNHDSNQRNRALTSTRGSESPVMYAELQIKHRPQSEI
ncbi:titin-like isoform X2 [Glandiceps talaboti]